MRYIIIPLLIVICLIVIGRYSFITIDGEPTYIHILCISLAFAIIILSFAHYILFPLLEFAIKYW